MDKSRLMEMISTSDFSELRKTLTDYMIDHELSVKSTAFKLKLARGTVIRFLGSDKRIESSTAFKIYNFLFKDKDGR